MLYREIMRALCVDSLVTPDTSVMDNGYITGQDVGIERLKDRAEVLGVKLDLSAGPEPLRELANDCSKTVDQIHDQGKEILACGTGRLI
jgi:hypothetical protein